MIFPSASFSPFEEPLEWTSARGGLRGSFSGSVFHGQSQSETAGASRGTVAADPWSVVIETEPAMIADIKAGDTISRRDCFDQELAVQQVTRDPDLGWVLVCTANEMSPK